VLDFDGPRWARRLAASVAILVLATTACSPPELGPASTSTSGTASEDQSSDTTVIDGSLSGTIVYSSAIEGNDDVFLLRLDGSEPTRLTDGVEKEFDPDLSPDGATIAYRRNPEPDSDFADIWVMGVDGSNKRNLTNSPEFSNWAPAWTPDGRIVFSSMREGGGALELWSMAADGSQLKRLSEGWCEYPQPSPDGTEFVCAAAVGGRYDIIIVDAAGGRRPLTTTPVTEFGPTWSPDGEWIVFSRDTGERWELLRVRSDGSDEQLVAEEGVFATWDPAGHLVWSGPGGINVAQRDGSDLVVLDYPADFISWGE